MEISVTRRSSGRSRAPGDRDGHAVADVSLLLLAAMWGLNFAVIKDALGLMDPMLYMMLRYLISATVMIAVVPRSVMRASRSDWLYGSILGVLFLVAFVAQTYGLQWTTPGKSGFITGLNVVMVPFILWAITRHSPGRVQIAGAAVAAVGLGVLSLRGDLTLGLGDGLTLVGAVCFALHIVATGFFAPRVRPTTLAITQIIVSLGLCLAIAPLVTEIRFDLPWRAWVALLWTAISGTVLAFLIQSWAQRHTTATRAAVILCLESVFSAGFGVVFGMDSITWRLVAGATLILSGILIIEALPARPNRLSERAAGEARADGQ